MSGFDKIRNMNLADLESPESMDDIPEEEKKEGAESKANLLTQSEDTLPDAGETAEAQPEESDAGEDGAPDEDAGEAAEGGEDSSQPEEEKLPLKMMDPQGEHYTFDADIEDSDLIRFMFSNTYRNPIMLVATIVGIIFPVGNLIRGGGNPIISIVCLAFFVLFLPLSTYFQAKRVRRFNKVYLETFHYMVDEYGVHLEVTKQAIDVPWNRMTRKIFSSEEIYLYTGRNNAFIIPCRSMGDQKEEIVAFMKKMTKGKK